MNYSQYTIIIQCASVFVAFDYLKKNCKWLKKTRTIFNLFVLFSELLKPSFSPTKCIYVVFFPSFLSFFVSSSSHTVSVYTMPIFVGLQIVQHHNKMMRIQTKQNNTKKKNKKTNPNKKSVTNVTPSLTQKSNAYHAMNKTKTQI